MKEIEKEIYNRLGWIVVIIGIIGIISITTMIMISEQKSIEVDYDKIANMTEQYLWDSDITCKEERIIINETINKTTSNPAFMYLYTGETLSCQNSNVTAVEVSNNSSEILAALDGTGECQFIKNTAICKTRSGRILWSTE